VTRVGFVMRAHPRDDAACLVSGAVKNPFRMLCALRDRIEVTGVVVVDHRGGFHSHGYDVRGLPLRGLKLYLRTFLWNLVNLPHVLRLCARSDVVQCHHPHFALGAAIARKLVFRRVRLVVKAHGTATPELAANDYGGWKGRVLRANAALHRRHDRLVLRCADLCLVSSDHQIEEMVSIYGMDRSRVRRVYNGVDARFLLPHARTREDAVRSPRLLFVGRVVPKKGYRHLFPMFEELRRRVPSVELTLVLGHRDAIEDPATFRTVTDAVERLDGCHVRFDLDERELYELLSISDLGVVPSIGYESIPTVVLEMGAAGLPVFATHRWGIPEVLPERFALSGEPVEDARRIERFVRDELGAWDAEGWADRYRRFHYDALASEYCDVYEQVRSA
jgi:glycosyltransferase involved in cell wall biosynthesis